MKTRRLLPLLCLSFLPAATALAPTLDEPSPTPVHRNGMAPIVHAATVESAPAEAVPPEAVPADPYLASQLMVQPPASMGLAALAAAIDGTVLRPVGRSGFGVIEVDDPEIAREALAALGAAPMPHARVIGAKKEKSDKTADTTDASVQPAGLPESWHLAAASVDTSDDLSRWVVAVLDTGVAYETDAAFQQAKGLSTLSFVAPADFVELDGHPNDDHQHGTHIASIIASTGELPGVAPGVSLMPIKVLDHTNSGTEWALIEGIHHAVDHGPT